METLRGIAVFPGVAIGPALVLDQEGFRILPHHVHPESYAFEISRLDASLSAVAEQMQANAETIRERFGSEVALIFEAHRRMVLDPHLRKMIVEKIEKEGQSVEFAVRNVLRRYEEQFKNLKGSHFADRVSDFRDIERQLLTKLVGERHGLLEGVDHEVVVVAYDLTPSETASFDPQVVRGLATATGGRTSHTAIVAGAMETPAIVGLGKFIESVSSGDMVIVDGNRGVLIINPDEPTLQKYRSSALDLRKFEESLYELRELPAETLDGVKVQLMGNIEFPHEAVHCLERGADGIGLYRTEFLYLNREDPPSEEEHYAAYSEVLRAIGHQKPVVFRTMDLGADKLNRHHDGPPEYNPFLGLRSIRLSLRNLSLFKVQLRALLRASPLGNLRIMFPLVTTVLELRRCRMVLADVMEDLEEEGIEFRRNIPIGMMVEVPSAALLADQFAKYVDFFSIGTNDLIQYTLAVDRTNENVASLYSASDPAVHKLVRAVIKAADRNGVAVNVCGEMSGDPIYTMLLIGMGLRQLSVTPHGIPEIKKIIRSITLADAKKVAARVQRLDTAGDITNYLRNRTRHIVPELIDDLG